MSSMRTVHVLLVEDNEGDIFLVSEAFEESQLNYKITVARDGNEAIELMGQLGEHEDAVYPDFILLDINLPKKSGHEVLAELKGSDTFKRIPIIIFTTSSSETDILDAYKNHANSYITKPDSADQLFEVLKNVENFWIKTSKLPKFSS